MSDGFFDVRSPVCVARGVRRSRSRAVARAQITSFREEQTSFKYDNLHFARATGGCREGDGEAATGATISSQIQSKAPLYAARRARQSSLNLLRI